VTEPWGWSTLSGSDEAWRQAGEEIFVRTIFNDLGPEAASRGQGLLELLKKSYKSQGPEAQARAALALRAAHWIAQEIQLWDSMDSVDRIALLVSAAGLHCEGGAALFSTESLLARSAAASYTLNALERVGFVDDHQALRLRRLVCRAIIRARPVCMLEDVHALRVQINKSGQMSAANANRGLLISVIAAYASYSFLSLPTDLHKPWALLRQEQAQKDKNLSTIPEGISDGDGNALDIASWIRALIQVLMLPMCETLTVFDGVGTKIHEPRKCLNANAKVWKTTKLAVSGRPGLREVADAGPGEAEPLAAKVTGRSDADYVEVRHASTPPEPPSAGRLGDDDHEALEVPGQVEKEEA
jgi:hypothetical protein